MAGSPDVYTDRLSEADLPKFAEFCCSTSGHDDVRWHARLDNFPTENAIIEGGLLLNTTHVFYADEQREALIGYAALACSSIKNEERATKIVPETSFPHIPVLLIGMLAIDARFHRQGYGSTIFRWIRSKARELPMGCRFIALHVQEDNVAAIQFYKRFRFWQPIRKSTEDVLLLYDLTEAEMEEDQLES